MKINILLLIVFVSTIFYSFLGYFEYDLIGCTELNGNGCVCHSVEASPEVTVWVEGPDTLLQGQTGLYKMFLTGGPAIAGGYNVAVKFGVLAAVDSLSHWDYRVPYELTQAFPLPFVNTSDTIFWNFAFTASGSIGTDTIYSCGLSTNWDTIPDFRDLWAFGPKYPVTIIEEVPVELISFSVRRTGHSINLTWSTASEINNMGFNIERSPDKKVWTNIAFIKGKGNSTEITVYTFNDEVLDEANYYYRLKQSDYNGSFVYSEIVSAGLFDSPAGYTLMQNYPNPFNPSTKIRYTIPDGQYNLTSLKIFDLLGNETAVLVNEHRSPGTYEVEFNAEELPSGVYIYKLESGSYAESKKLLLLK